MNDPKILRGALLWLRNHYDVGKPINKAAVLKVIDRLLDEGDGLSHADQVAFREWRDAAGDLDILSH